MHHANLLIGSRTWGYASIPSEELVSSSDVIRYEDDQLSIAQVRTLIHEASLKPVERTHRTFIITATSILHEAQNALLKLFEEPNPDTIFYLVIPREDILLPTLRSRLHHLATEEGVDTEKVFGEFRKLGTSARLHMIEERLDAEDKDWIQGIVSGFESYTLTKRDPKLMREAMQISSYFHAPGSSKKMLLEHLALML